MSSKETLAFDKGINFLSDFVEVVTPPKKLQKKEYLTTGEFPIIDQGEGEIAGWTNDISVLVRPDKNGLIVFGDHTCRLKFIETPFAQGADGLKILRVAGDVPARYLYAFLNLFPLQNDGYRRHFADLQRKEIVRLPAEKEEYIGNLYFNFDANILENQKVAQYLEIFAQTIFKSWFVDFDPVHAKARGEKPVGMDDETAALFPDSFVDSELGLIPSGWSRKVFGDFVVPKKGKVITKANTNAGSIPVVAGGLEPAYFHSQANVINPVVTISASGANAGFVRLYLEDIWASDCTYISSEQTDYVWFSYAFLKYQQERIFDMQQGGAQPHIYASDLMRLEITLPPSDILINTFDTMVTPFFNQIRNLNEQNRTLTSLRDALLPRLISGELEIPEELL